MAAVKRLKMSGRHVIPCVRRREAQTTTGRLACLLALSFLLLSPWPACAAQNNEAAADESAGAYGNVTEKEARAEGPQIADPLQPWNRAMYRLNDKLYFWALKPATKVYKSAVPEGIRGVFVNFYRNIKAPVRIVNNLLQGKPGYAGIELGKFLINSTVGVGGLRDCATDCFGINGRNADFGQTLGKYGVGFGFYTVWPFLGPSCPRDTIGWAADEWLTPTTYLSSQWLSPMTVGIYAHEEINDLSFHLGDYEALLAAAIDPYVAMRDAYVQHRTQVIEK